MTTTRPKPLRRKSKWPPKPARRVRFVPAEPDPEHPTLFTLDETNQR